MNSGRPCGAVFGLGLVHAHPFDPLFDIADAGQVFVELGLVARADLAAELRSAILDAVEDAEVAQAAAVLEEAVKCKRGVHLVGHRRVGALPGDVRAVGVGVVGFVVAGHGLLAGEDEARLRGFLADAIGEYLVEADAAVDDGALGDRDAGEQVAGHRRVDAQTGGGLVEQSVDNVDLRLQRFERRKRLAELHFGAASPWPRNVRDSRR